MRTAKPLNDPYRILGIVRAADIDQIKAAHRRLAKRYHPDGSTGDEARFLAVQEAYQLLTDTRRRSDWDRRHAPGPVRADEARKRTRPKSAARARTRGTAGTTSRPAASRRTARPARDSQGRTRTWSADRVPWWEDFVPRSQRAASDPPRADDPVTEAPPTPRPAQMDFDVFNRSSGAAWSMAARKYFRRGDADLPSRGAWRYRGTQVVTGAEARKVAAEEAAEASGRGTRQRRATEKSTDS